MIVLFGADIHINLLTTLPSQSHKIYIQRRNATDKTFVNSIVQAIQNISVIEIE